MPVSACTRGSSLRKNLSNTLGSSSAAMPTPVSCTGDLQTSVFDCDLQRDAAAVGRVLGRVAQHVDQDAR